MSEVFKERLSKIEELKSSGFPLYSDQFEPTDHVAHLLESFQDGKRVKVAGRMMTRRVHGKSTFAHLKDDTGKIQIYIKFDVVGKESYERFQALDIGDILGVEGSLFI